MSFDFAQEASHRATSPFGFRRNTSLFFYKHIFFKKISEIYCYAVPQKAFRYTLIVSCIGVPFILLFNGIYGSFLFAFPIPLLWQLGYLRQPLSSLGLQKKLLIRSIIAGVISGCILGLLGGNILRLLALTSNSFIQTDSLRLAIGKFEIDFPLMKELGYRLLTRSNDSKGLFLYLTFSVFIIGLGEEMFWRGFIQKKISSRVTQPFAILITSILFAVTHFYIFAIFPINTGIILLTLIGVVGAIWGYLFAKIGNIWSVALSHGIVAFIIWKYFFFVPVTN